MRGVLSAGAIWLARTTAAYLDKTNACAVHAGQMVSFVSVVGSELG